MSYKTILACLTTPAHARQLSRAACELARKFDAHLIGIHTLQAVTIYPGIAMHIPGDVFESFNTGQERQAEDVRQVFEEATRAQDFVAEWRLVRADATSAGGRLTEHARCADLVVMMQPDAESDRPDQHTIHREVIEGCGRPVLVLPSEGEFDTFGKKVVIGWSAARESARALHDAVPFMRGGGEAVVFSVAGAGREEAYLAHTANEVALTLDRQGVRAEVVSRERGTRAVGEELLQEALEVGADMIATGGYGHSRLYDFVMGAATSHLLANMTVPVLFSH